MGRTGGKGNELIVEEVLKFMGQELTRVVRVKGAHYDCGFGAMTIEQRCETRYERTNASGCLRFFEKIDSLEARMIVNENKYVSRAATLGGFERSGDVTVNETSGISALVSVGSVRSTGGVAGGARITCDVACFRKRGRSVGRARGESAKAVDPTMEAAAHGLCRHLGRKRRDM